MTSQKAKLDRSPNVARVVLLGLTLMMAFARSAPAQPEAAEAPAGQDEVTTKGAFAPDEGVTGGGTAESPEAAKAKTRYSPYAGRKRLSVRAGFGRPSARRPG
jgi:hypothetical protein